MSTFVRFNGKNYKLPDALTLGRGEPFDISDQSLARAHARLLHKNGKWRIKDLGSDCGININGKKVNSGRFLNITPNDKILLGNIELEILEKNLELEYTEVRSFTANDLTDYASIIYFGLFLLAVVMAVTGSTGEYSSDLIFLICACLFLKVASILTKMIRTVYFPMNVVLETNLTSEGVTFHFASNNNFSLKFKDVTKWHVVGKCFYIEAYKKNRIYLMGQGHQELETLLRKRCDKKKSMVDPFLEKIALLPVGFVFTAWILLVFPESRFFHFIGHGIGIIGLLGLVALFFSEHLRELLPIPTHISAKAQNAFLAVLIVSTMILQFTQIQNQYKITKLKKQLTTCLEKSDCKKINFSLFAQKELPEPELDLLAKICAEGNATACLKHSKRKPASKGIK